MQALAVHAPLLPKAHLDKFWKHKDQCYLYLNGKLLVQRSTSKMFSGVLETSLQATYISPPPPNIDPSDLFFVGICAQGVFTGFYRTLKTVLKWTKLLSFTARTTTL